MSAVYNFGRSEYTWEEGETLESYNTAWDITAEYQRADVDPTPHSEVASAPPVRFELLPLTTETVVPGTVKFTALGDTYIDRKGQLYRAVDAQGAGTLAGEIDYATGAVVITDYPGGTTSVNVHTLITRRGAWTVDKLEFRTPGSPIKPGSLYFQVSTPAGDLLEVTGDFGGNLSATGLEGEVDYDTGVVRLWFGEYVNDADLSPEDKNEPWYDPDLVDEDGRIWRPQDVLPDTASFNCVVLQSLPLDADLLGLDPVRLPSDGRVPIYQPAGVVVLHNTDADALPAGLSPGQVVELSRDRVAQVWLTDAEGRRVDPAQYSVDNDAGRVTIADPLDLSGYTEPLTAHHRIEDMLLVSDVQIHGRLGVIGGATRAYPAETSYVSSALIFGDLQARVRNFFTQDSWNGSTWSDTRQGNGTTAQYNSVQYPVQVENQGAIKERWGLRFTSSTTFDVIGETVGVIGTGTVAEDCAPLNPQTGSPYFQVKAAGWGGGWQAGNVVRFNTEAAAAPMWIARTILPGEATAENDSFRIQNRGDAD